LLRFLKEVSKRFQRVYVIKYFVCEVLGSAVLVLNMILVHLVFNDFWTGYRPAMTALFNGDMPGFKLLSTAFFPTMAKCTYNNFGSGGSKQRFDALCFLPQNVINEKIFVFLYVWYLLMVVATVINLIIIIVMLSMKSLRVRDISRMSDGYYRLRDIIDVSNNGDFGYWFMLHIIHRNLSPLLFHDLMIEMMTGSKAKATKVPNKSKKQDFDEEIGDTTLETSNEL